MIDGGLLQDFTYRIWNVLSAMHFTADTWGLISLTAIKKCFAHYGFPVDHVSSTDSVTLKFTEDEENDWHSLQPSGVWFEDYTTCASTPKICGVHTVSHVLDHS
jgi:hypothetical protein